MLKLLQLQPEKEIIVEFIRNEDYKYVRVLGERYLSSHTLASCMPYFGPALGCLLGMPYFLVLHSNLDLRASHWSCILTLWQCKYQELSCSGSIGYGIQEHST